MAEVHAKELMAEAMNMNITNRYLMKQENISQMIVYDVKSSLSRFAGGA